MAVAFVQHRRALLRAGIAAVVASEPRIEAVCTVAAGPELLGLLDVHLPGVVVLELLADGWSVLDHVTELRSRGVPRVVALYDGRPSDEVRLARRSGVTALVAYDASDARLLHAVRGDPQPALRTTRGVGRSGLLTEREREVLCHIAAGLTTTESASFLGISPKTVDNHKQRIFTKLGVQNQAHAVSLGHRIGALHDRVRAGGS